MLGDWRGPPLIKQTKPCWLGLGKCMPISPDVRQRRCRRRVHSGSNEKGLFRCFAAGCWDKSKWNVPDQFLHWYATALRDKMATRCTWEAEHTNCSSPVNLRNRWRGLAVPSGGKKSSLSKVKGALRCPTAEIVPAGDRLGRGAGAAEHGQNQGGKNCDDTDGHQQFDQCKCA